MLDTVKFAAIGGDGMRLSPDATSASCFPAARTATDTLRG